MGHIALRVGLGSRGSGAAAGPFGCCPVPVPSGYLLFSVVALARLAFLSRLGGSFRSLWGNMRKQPPRVGIFSALFRFSSPLRNSGFGGVASVLSLRCRASGAWYDAGLVWSVCASFPLFGLCSVCACVVAHHASSGCPSVVRGCAVAALVPWSDVFRRGSFIARRAVRGRKNAENSPSSGLSCRSRCAFLWPWRGRCGRGEEPPHRTRA